MWRSIVEAWINARSGLCKADPTSPAEILRQPIFGNQSILNQRRVPLGVGGQREGNSFAQVGHTRVKDFWNNSTRGWKSLTTLGMSHHPSNRECRERIVSSIPWRPDELEDQTRVGDWIANLAPPAGNPLDWVYLVLAKEGDTATVLEFKKTSTSSRIQLSSNQAIKISTINHQPIRVLSQENPKATLKVARDPPAPDKKALLYWIFDSGLIQNLPWDPGEWHWQPSPPLGDAPFFGYSAKRGYSSIRKSAHMSSMATFLKDLNLRNSTTTQLTARIWHSARPRKVGTLIWLILNNGLLVGTWLRTMGLPSLCKVCDANKEESPQHCLLECDMAQRAWDAYKRIWSKWHSPDSPEITWPFVLLGEATIEQEDDPLGRLAYHVGGFTYPRQPLDILRSLIVYRLWTERCRKHYENKYSLTAVLTQAWVATVE
ncbi:unnamed protein product, partial [Sphagnum compactum]